MSGVLAGGFCASVAAGAVAGDVGVVEDCAVPVGGVMTILTGVAIANVCGMLTGCRRAVVAGEAGADDVSVRHAGDRNPAAAAVAILAQGIGLDMGGVLAGGGAAVVTADAVAGDTAVVEHCTTPAGGVVAVVAAVVAGDVVGRLADGGRTVVTGEAGAGNTRVIKPGTTKAVGGMTVIAVAAAGHVIR